MSYDYRLRIIQWQGGLSQWLEDGSRSFESNYESIQRELAESNRLGNRGNSGKNPNSVRQFGTGHSRHSGR
jgi:hypothetical protein